MSSNPTGAAGGGEGTSTTSSAATTGGSASGSAVPGAQTGRNVQGLSPADAPPTAPHGALGNLGASEAAAAAGTSGSGQTAQSVGYPLRVLADNHTHAGRQIKRGETIALDAAEYRWAIANQIGEPGKRDDVGKPVDDSGNVITEETKQEIPLPEDQAINPAEAAAATPANGEADSSAAQQQQPAEAGTAKGSIKAGSK
jgi:hypothetical protein